MEERRMKWTVELARDLEQKIQTQPTLDDALPFTSVPLFLEVMLWLTRRHGLRKYADQAVGYQVLVDLQKNLERLRVETTPRSLDLETATTAHLNDYLVDRARLAEQARQLDNKLADRDRYLRQLDRMFYTFLCSFPWPATLATLEAPRQVIVPDFIQQANLHNWDDVRQLFDRVIRHLFGKIAKAAVAKPVVPLVQAPPVLFPRPRERPALPVVGLEQKLVAPVQSSNRLVLLPKHPTSCPCAKCAAASRLHAKASAAACLPRLSSFSIDEKDQNDQNEQKHQKDQTKEDSETAQRCWTIHQAAEALEQSSVGTKKKITSTLLQRLIDYHQSLYGMESPTAEAFRQLRADIDARRIGLNRLATFQVKYAELLERLSATVIESDDDLVRLNQWHEMHAGLRSAFEKSAERVHTQKNRITDLESPQDTATRENEQWQLISEADHCIAQLKDIVDGLMDKYSSQSNIPAFYLESLKDKRDLLYSISIGGSNQSEQIHWFDVLNRPAADPQPSFSANQNEQLRRAILSLDTFIAEDLINASKPIMDVLLRSYRLLDDAKAFEREYKNLLSANPTNINRGATQAVSAILPASPWLVDGRQVHFSALQKMVLTGILKMPYPTTTTEASSIEIDVQRISRIYSAQHFYQCGRVPGSSYWDAERTRHCRYADFGAKAFGEPTIWDSSTIDKQSKESIKTEAATLLTESVTDQTMQRCLQRLHFQQVQFRAFRADKAKQECLAFYSAWPAAASHLFPQLLQKALSNMVNNRGDALLWGILFGLGPYMIEQLMATLLPGLCKRFPTTTTELLRHVYQIWLVARFNARQISSTSAAADLARTDLESSVPTEPLLVEEDILRPSRHSPILAVLLWPIAQIKDLIEQSATLKYVLELETMQPNVQRDMECKRLAYAIIRSQSAKTFTKMQTDYLTMRWNLSTTVLSNAQLTTILQDQTSTLTAKKDPTPIQAAEPPKAQFQQEKSRHMDWARRLAQFQSDAPLVHVRQQRS